VVGGRGPLLPPSRAGRVGTLDRRRSRAPWTRSTGSAPWPPLRRARPGRKRSAASSPADPGQGTASWTPSPHLPA